MTNQTHDMDMGNTMVVELDNLANISIQKKDTVEQLVISNASLSDSLASQDTEIARLLTIITNLYTGGGSRGGGGNGTNNEKNQQTTLVPQRLLLDTRLQDLCWPQQCHML